jgi:hypothetical protein
MSFLRKATSERAAGPVRIEVPRADDLSKAPGIPFEKGNRKGGKKPKLAKLGLGKIDSKDPSYQNCLRQAESYRRARVREYLDAFGHVTIGVKGLLATAALQLAASRYMIDKAMEMGDMDMLKKGSAIGNDARQNELAAWELCSRERVVHEKKEANDMPWVRVADGKKHQDTLDGCDTDENLQSHTGAEEAPRQRIYLNE